MITPQHHGHCQRGIVHTMYYSLLTGQYTLPGGVNIKALRRRWFVRC
jgi:hypothetical protein